MSHTETPTDQALLREWRATLDHKLGKGEAARFLLREGRTILRRALRWLRDLWSMPRHLRRRWQRRLGMSLAGAALFFALNSAPALADTVDVTTTDDHLSDTCANITMANVTWVCL